MLEQNLLRMERRKTIHYGSPNNDSNNNSKQHYLHTSVNDTTEKYKLVHGFMSHAEAMHNNLILDQSLLLLNSLCPMYCHRLTIPIQ